MAVLGLTEVQAVNRLLRAINQNPVTLLDLSGVAGTSIQARAQEVLEETLLTKLIAGLEENTINTILNPDLAVTGGTLSSVTAVAAPVVTAANAHVVTTSHGVRFYNTNTFPSLMGPYTVSNSATPNFTITAGQVTITTAGTSGTWLAMSKITVPANTLRVIGDGNDQFRTLAFDSTGNKLIDVDHGATQFFDGPVAVKLVFNPGVFGGTGSSGSTAFENCQPATKEAIANEAALIFQRRKRGAPEQDSWLEEERVKTEMVVAKPISNRDDMPINPVPISLIPPQGRSQQN